MNDYGSLRRLARLYGIQPAYYDVSNQLQQASGESLMQTLRILGAPVSGGKHLVDALRSRHRELWQQVLEPVIVAWDGRVDAALRFPVAERQKAFRCDIALEDGSRQEWTGRLAELSSVRVRKVDGVDYTASRLRLPFPVPWGYHRMTVEFDRQRAEAHLISAPRMAWQAKASGQTIPAAAAAIDEADAAELPSRFWGVFLPLYALYRQSSWGAGDFSDLEALMEWVSHEGGNLVATLPLLAWQSDISEDFSPYSPASRLFWNEFYLDVTRIPELQHCERARQVMNSREFRSELDDLRGRRLVDYRHQMQLKHRVLEELAEEFFAGQGERRQQFEQFRKQRPEVEAYARFRAVGHRLGRGWNEWPEPLRSGSIQQGDYDENVSRYHQYVQWQLHEQLTRLRSHADRLNLVWYLDYPLGTSCDGYDVWREQRLFAEAASGGAPPDSFFTKGQDWGFPPMRPDELRRQGYRYFIESLRHHLQFARLLRVDHVMGLHRLYWIPRGCDPSQGVYVRYHSEELLAVLMLESHRYQAEIIGENLGTVPDAVNVALNRHGMRQMYVLQYEIDREGKSPVHPVPENAVASLNTHDMPQFAAFWTGLDVDDRRDLGLLTEEGASEERENRAALRQAMVRFLRSENLLEEDTLDPLAVLKACLTWLSGGPAHTVLVNLEDLWQEAAPQNTPGTFRERNNWRRKARYSLEEFSRLPEVIDVLRTVDQHRKIASDAIHGTSVAPGA